MEKRKVILFTLITFALSWIAWWILVFIKQDNSGVFQNPLYFSIFFIGGIAPTITPFLAIYFSDKKFKDYIFTFFRFRNKSFLLFIQRMSDFWDYIPRDLDQYTY